MLQPYLELFVVDDLAASMRPRRLQIASGHLCRHLNVLDIVFLAQDGRAWPSKWLLWALLDSLEDATGAPQIFLELFVLCSVFAQLDLTLLALEFDLVNLLDQILQVMLLSLAVGRPAKFLALLQLVDVLLDLVDCSLVLEVTDGSLDELVLVPQTCTILLPFLENLLQRLDRLAV